MKLHVSDSSSVHHHEFFTVHTAMVYVIRVCWQLASRIRMELQFHPDPARKMSEKLYDIYHCCVYSEKLSTILILLASCLQNCMTYTIPVCTVKNSVPSWSCSQAVCKTVRHIPLLCVQWKTPDDGQRNCPKHEEFHSMNKFEKLVHLVGFIIRIYHDTRSLERQIHCRVFTSVSNENAASIFRADPSYNTLRIEVIGFSEWYMSLSLWESGSIR